MIDSGMISEVGFGEKHGVITTGLRSPKYGST